MTPFSDVYNGVITLIEEALDQEGWTRKEFALALGKSKGWVSQVMSKTSKNKIGISLQTLIDIARVLKMEPAKLIPKTRGADMGVPQNLSEHIEKVMKKNADFFRELIREEISKLNKKGD